MADIAKLQIIVDSSQAKTATQNLQGLESQSKKTETAVGGLGKQSAPLSRSMQMLVSQVKQTNTALTGSGGLTSAFQGLSSVTTQSIERQGAFSKSVKQLGSHLDILSNSIFTVKNLIGVFFVTSLVRAMDQMTTMEGRLRNATRSTQEYEQAWSGLNDQAKRMGTDPSAGLGIFQRLSQVRDEIHATVDDMLQFTETVQKLGVVSGASGDAMKFGLAQLGQSMSSNIVRAEEFNSIMENVPAVGKAIADEFGITTGQLRRLVVDGKVLSEDVFAAILNQTEKANEQFENMPMTIGRATQALWNQIKILISGFDETTNSTGILVSMIDKVTQAVKGLHALILIVGSAIKIYWTGVAAGFLDMINMIIDQLNKIPEAVNTKFKTDLPTIPRIGGEGANFREEGAAEIREEINGLISDINVLFPAQEALSTSTRKITTDYKGMADALGDTSEEAAKAAKKIKDVVDGLEFNIQQLQRSNIEQEIYNNLRAAGTTRDTAAGRQIESLTRTYEGMSEALEYQKDIAEDLGDAFTDAFGDAVLGAESFGDALSNLFKELQKIIFQMTVLDPLKKALTGGSSGGGLFGSILGGIGSFFSGGSVSSSIAAASARGIANPALYGPGFATGGSFTVGGSGGIDSQQVSFRATPGEMVNISRPGQNNGSVVHQYSIDARGAAPGVELQIKAALMEIRRVDRSIEARSTAAVRDANKRNPNFMKAT